jgi:transposase InsO family protein
MPINPKDPKERMAIFRKGLIGELASRDLPCGELKLGLEELAQRTYRPPDACRSRRYGFSTLERWYYQLKEHGLPGLEPKPRSDQGFAQKLTEAERALLLDIAEQQPEVSIPIILREVVQTGRLREKVVSEPTVRRLFAAHGLNRRQRRALVSKGRRRWQRAHPHDLWHADVCHGPTLAGDAGRIPVRVHGIMDDASRFVVGLRALSTEREVDMLLLMAEALRRYPPPAMLFVDNGATYSGKALEVVCARLDITLIHAKPYDPQARGKMERFWRTLRAGCLDYTNTCRSLHDVQVRLTAFLERHYHTAPHGGLRGGAAPREVFHREASSTRAPLTEAQLEDAFTVRESRTVSKDGVLSVGGMLWEVEPSFLDGHKVTVARSLLSTNRPPWIEVDDQTYAVRPLDPVANGLERRIRESKDPKLIDAIPFDPASALLRRLIGHTPHQEDSSS